MRGGRGARPNSMAVYSLSVGEDPLGVEYDLAVRVESWVPAGQPAPRGCGGVARARPGRVALPSVRGAASVGD